MMNRHRSRAAAFVKKYLMKLLLLAVVLTTGFSLRFAAQAKYTAYLYDYTGAVAEDFCFSSNYLKEKASGSETTVDHVIGGWDGKDYTLLIELRNFENSLRFNKSDVDTCFYIETKVEHSDGDGGWTENTAAEFTYTVSPAEIKKGKYNTAYDCVLLEGMDEFDRQAGTCMLGITFDFDKTSDEPVEEDQRMTVTVRTVPPTQTENVTGITDYTGYGVYDVTLAGVFELQHAVSSRTINASCTRPDANSREIVYSLKSESLSGTGITKVRVYYDPTKLQADPNLLLIGETPQTDTNGTYFEVQVQSNSITRISFYTDGMEAIDTTNHYIGIGENKIHYMASLDETGEYGLWFAVVDESAEGAEPGGDAGGGDSGA